MSLHLGRPIGGGHVFDIRPERKVGDIGRSHVAGVRIPWPVVGVVATADHEASQQNHTSNGCTHFFPPSGEPDYEVPPTITTES